jgi:2-keto-4-pentenoate hydratase/2-oxohepta-3-ene-1,7-dioic acid hydratase in catechol pathway
MRIVRYADGAIRYGLLAANGDIRPLVGSPFESFETAGPATHLDKVRLLAPVQPRNLYGVGLNYVKHAQEVKLPLPSVPMLFMKPTSTVIGPEAPILYPTAKPEKNVHFEAEVAVIIARPTRRISEARALDCVLGFTCGNDVSERVIQSAEMKQGCLLVGKAYDSFNPLGPAIETDLEPGDIAILGRVNGVERQNSNTNDLVYSIRQLVAYLSDAFTLLPGDVIMTGTPSGVGPIVPGDVVEIEIPPVGVLRNPVIDDAAVAS